MRDRAVIAWARRAMHVVAPLAVLLVAACKEHPATTDDPEAPASPQAAAVPAPLASGDLRDTRRGATTAASASADASTHGPPPTPLRGDAPLSADFVVRESSGYTLSATFRTSGIGVPPRSPELNASAVEAARKKTELSVAIDLGPSRMRVAMQGQGFLWPQDTEVRARSDRYGHVVVWPGETSYRPLAPGAMRAFFGERRLDVGPVSTTDVHAKDETGKRIGVRTRKVEVSTRAADATMDVGRLSELGEGGVLLCRLILDLMSASPSTPVCTADELPMRAELRWKSRGSLVFEVTGVLRRSDVPPSALAVPPPTATFLPSIPAPEGVSATIPPPELAAFRTAPIDVAVSPDANPEGLVVENTTEEPRLLFVDGVPVARVAAGAQGVVRGFVRGRYLVQWRTFLGDAFEDPVPIVVPGFTRVGSPLPSAEAK